MRCGVWRVGLALWAVRLVKVREGAEGRGGDQQFLLLPPALLAARAGDGSLHSRADSAPLLLVKAE